MPTTSETSSRTILVRLDSLCYNEKRFIRDRFRPTVILLPLTYRLTVGRASANLVLGHGETSVQTDGNTSRRHCNIKPEAMNWTSTHEAKLAQSAKVPISCQDCRDAVCHARAVQLQSHVRSGEPANHCAVETPLRPR